MRSTTGSLPTIPHGRPVWHSAAAGSNDTKKCLRSVALYATPSYSRGATLMEFICGCASDEAVQALCTRTRRTLARTFCCFCVNVTASCRIWSQALAPTRSRILSAAAPFFCSSPSSRLACHPGRQQLSHRFSEPSAPLIAKHGKASAGLVASAFRDSCLMCEAWSKTMITKDRPSFTARANTRRSVGRTT